MTALLSPATGDYLLMPAPEQLHQEAVEWLSDLEFYATELNFFSHLLTTTRLVAESPAVEDQLTRLEKKVDRFREKRLSPLRQSLVAFEKHLSDLDLETFHARQEPIQTEHRELNRSLREFWTDLKQLKSDLFRFVEEQMKKK
jgi:lipase chaperone LimK